AAEAEDRGQPALDGVRPVRAVPAEKADLPRAGPLLPRPRAGAAGGGGGPSPHRRPGGEAVRGRAAAGAAGLGAGAAAGAAAVGRAGGGGGLPEAAGLLRADRRAEPEDRRDGAAGVARPEHGQPRGAPGAVPEGRADRVPGGAAGDPDRRDAG